MQQPILDARPGGNKDQAKTHEVKGGRGAGRTRAGVSLRREQKTAAGSANGGAPRANQTKPNGTPRDMPPRMDQKRGTALASLDFFIGPNEMEKQTILPGFALPCPPGKVGNGRGK